MDTRPLKKRKIEEEHEKENGKNFKALLEVIRKYPSAFEEIHFDTNNQCSVCKCTIDQIKIEHVLSHIDGDNQEIIVDIMNEVDNIEARVEEKKEKIFEIKKNKIEEINKIFSNFLSGIKCKYCDSEISNEHVINNDNIDEHLEKLTLFQLREIEQRLNEKVSEKTKNGIKIDGKKPKSKKPIRKLKSKRPKSKKPRRSKKLKSKKPRSK